MKVKRNNVRIGFFAFVAAIFAYMLFPADAPPAARRMVFIFVLAAIFWALEIVPLYATSILVVLMQIFLLKVDYTTFLNPFSNPVIFLFLGGFTLATAMHKHHLDTHATGRLVSFLGSRTYLLVLGFMIATALLSFWMSGTAASAMMLTLIQPLLEQTPDDKSFRKALVLSVPLGARIGGLCTPIGTPPNAIAIGFLEKHGHHMDFLSWMAMGVPLALIMFLVSAATLFFFFRPHHDKIKLQTTSPKSLSPQGISVMIITLITITLWISSGLHHTPEAVISLLAVGIFFSTGLLDKDDLKKIDWDILLLMWGGLALGEGMEASGLTAWLVSSPLFSHSGPTLAVVLCFLAMGVSTFMSNTAAANLLIPLAIGFSVDNAAALTVAVALSCSFDVPLPISSPPNALAYSTGVVSVRDMLKVGVPIAITAILLIIAFSQVAIGPILLQR
jgi:sodium-dependent dicarboxylate transporter 2/3/5